VERMRRCVPDTRAVIGAEVEARKSSGKERGRETGGEKRFRTRWGHRSGEEREGAVMEWGERRRDPGNEGENLVEVGKG